MKMNFLCIAAVTLPVLAGCANANSETSGATNGAAPVLVTAQSPHQSTNEPPAVVPPVGSPVTSELSPPDDVKLSSAAAEVVRLAQAGVDSNVMLAYITNSTHTFGLSSAEIVYLNDLGIPSAVMTAMIQHDQRIRETSPATPALGQSTWSSAPALPGTNTWQQTVAAPAPTAQPDGLAAAPPPPKEELPDQVTVNSFYEPLSPYGMWIDIEGYGRCWRPTVVVSNPGWRPYVHGGRWVWTDLGWYWYSDYSWGWAPFHYGRWFSHPHWGWCWYPGSVWGPAWVSWSYSDDYCGWAPLPPAAYYRPGFGFTYYGSSCNAAFSFGISWGCYTYVSFSHFGGHHYDSHCVPHHEVHRIYKTGTVVNNYIVGNNNTIINQGFGTAPVERATRTEVHRTVVREAGSRGSRPGRIETLAPDGRTLTVARPVISSTQTAVRPGVRPPSLNPVASGSSGSGRLAPDTRNRAETVRPSSVQARRDPSAGRPVAGASPEPVNSPSAPAPVVRAESPRGATVLPAPNRAQPSSRLPETATKDDNITASRGPERTSPPRNDRRSDVPSSATASTQPPGATVQSSRPSPVISGSSRIVPETRSIAPSSPSRTVNPRSGTSASPVQSQPVPSQSGNRMAPSAAPTWQSGAPSRAAVSPNSPAAVAPAPSIRPQSVQPSFAPPASRYPERSAPGRVINAPAPQQSQGNLSVPRSTAPSYTPPAPTRAPESRPAPPPAVSAPRPAPAPSAPPPRQSQPQGRSDDSDSGGKRSRNGR